MGIQSSLFEDGESREIEAEERFLASSRDSLKAQGKTSIMALDFHLWEMAREERDCVTLQSLRDKLSYLSPMLVSDADIQAAVTRANNFRHKPISG